MLVVVFFLLFFFFFLDICGTGSHGIVEIDVLHLVYGTWG